METTGRNEGDASRGGGYRWIGGVVLILIGLVFLLQNVSGVYLDNWWAFLLLIPVVATFASAYQSYRRAGRFNRAAAGSLTGGLFILAVAIIFLLRLDWGRVWPVFVILAGVGALLTSSAER